VGLCSSGLDTAGSGGQSSVTAWQSTAFSQRPLLTGVYSHSGGGGVTQLRLAHGVLPARLVVSCIGSVEASLVAHRLTRGRSVDSDIVVAATVVSCAVWLRL